jgi:hypothetical protein
LREEEAEKGVKDKRAVLRLRKGMGAEVWMKE